MKLSLVLLLFWLSVVSAYTEIKCNASHHCPEDLPCCSQYGTCGTGSVCLGGCDVRYSYNLTACMPMPIMSSFHDDLDSTDGIEEQQKYLGNSSEANFLYTGHIALHNDALLLQMPNHSTGTVLSSTKYLWYGKIGLNMKTSRDRGVITAFITFSDVQDEIDFEFLGYQLTYPQTNYYALGITNYTNVKNSTTSDTFENWHYYEIDWHEDHIDWLIDGNKVRTLEKKDTWNETLHRYNYPQTPSRVQLSLWPGGSHLNGLGTIEWAGGEINWDSEDMKKNGYYYAYVKNFTVETYSLPKFAQSNHSDYHAFEFNLTDGNDVNVFLTNKKTYLGNQGASGLDPQNDSDSEDEDDNVTSTTVESSGTHKLTVTKTSSNAKTTNGGDGGKKGGQKTTSTEDYTGGFDQGFQTAAATSGKAKSNTGDSGAASSPSLQSLVTFVSTLFGAVLAFGL